MDRNSLLRQASRAIDRASSRLIDGGRSMPRYARSSSAGPSSVFASKFYGHQRRKSSPKLTDPSSPFGSSRFLLDATNLDLSPLDDGQLPALVDPKDDDSHGKKQPHDQVVELRVSLHCKGCEGKVRKHISKMKGVTSFSIDFETKKVTVLGNLTAQDVLASVSKVKNAELWSSSSPSPL